MSPEEMSKINLWHTNLKELFDSILARSTKKVKWSWTKSRGWKCKYIDIRIDMRDGGYILRNDAGKRIDISELEFQEPDL